MVVCPQKACCGRRRPRSQLLCRPRGNLEELWGAHRAATITILTLMRKAQARALRRWQWHRPRKTNNHSSCYSQIYAHSTCRTNSNKACML